MPDAELVGWIGGRGGCASAEGRGAREKGPGFGGEVPAVVVG